MDELVKATDLLPDLLVIIRDYCGILGWSSQYYLQPDYRDNYNLAPWDIGFDIVYDNSRQLFFADSRRSVIWEAKTHQEDGRIIIDFAERPFISQSRSLMGDESPFWERLYLDERWLVCYYGKRRKFIAEDRLKNRTYSFCVRQSVNPDSISVHVENNEPVIGYCRRDKSLVLKGVAGNQIGGLDRLPYISIRGMLFNSTAIFLLVSDADDRLEMVVLDREELEFKTMKVVTTWDIDSRDDDFPTLFMDARYLYLDSETSTGEKMVDVYTFNGAHQGTVNIDWGMIGPAQRPKQPGVFYTREENLTCYEPRFLF
jgi:hypothetical protein